MTKYWMYVISAGIIEVLWVSGLKHSETALQWTGTITALICSFILILIATKYLPIGTVYAVFAGIGTAGTVLAEMLVFGEPFNLVKVILIIVLLTGVIGLKSVTMDYENTEGEGL